MTAARKGLTGPARRWRDAGLGELFGVASRSELARAGIGHSVVAAHLRARRWRRFGTAIILHNGPMTRAQRERAMLVNCGPRSVLTSFTAIAASGLRGWERSEIHVLAPAGTRRPALDGLVLHRVSEWDRTGIIPARRLHRFAPALLIAAASFDNARPACALVAAAVQQRLATPSELRRALDGRPKLRHIATLRLALNDIEQGAQALSEIDFVRLCRRHRLPIPNHQAVRVEPDGRRRYLDAEWKLPSGRRLAVEVDGAIHLAPREWILDALRQNEIVLAGTPVLRFPSIVIRTDERRVADQLRRGLLG